MKFLTPLVLYSYKVLLRGKAISGDPMEDGALLLDEIEPTRKRWKIGKTKVGQLTVEIVVFSFVVSNFKSKSFHKTFKVTTNEKLYLDEPHSS